MTENPLVRQKDLGPQGQKLDKAGLDVTKDERVLEELQRRRVSYFSELIIAFVKAAGYAIKIEISKSHM